MALNPALRQRIARAQVGIQKDPVIRDGQYVMLIKEMRIIPADVTGVGDMFSGALKVERATGVTQGVEPNPNGSDCATKCNLSTNRAAISNVKQMVAGALGLADPNAINEDEWQRILDWVFSDAQPMRGMLIAGTTFRTQIKNGKNAGQPFVGVNWSQVPNQQPSDIASRRAQLDALDAQKPPVPVAPPQAPQYAPQGSFAPQAPQFAPPQYAPQAPQYAPAPFTPPQAPPQYAPPAGGFAPQFSQPQQPQYGGSAQPTAPFNPNPQGGRGW